MQINVEIPDRFGELANPQEWQHNLKLHSAMILFQQHVISLSAGAELAGVDIYSFMQSCSKNGIPVIDYEEGQLEAEAEAVLKALATKKR